MGFNPGLLDLVVGWAADHQLRPGAAVLDVGTSELFCAGDPSSLNRFLAHFGAEPYGDEELGRKADRGPAAELFQRAGLDYMAIDFAPFPHTMQLDLNGLRFRPNGTAATPSSPIRAPASTSSTNTMSSR